MEYKIKSLFERGKKLVESLTNKKPGDLIKVNLYYHPYKLKHISFVMADEISVYGYTSLMLKLENKVADIIGIEYIESVEL